VTTVHAPRHSFQVTKLCPGTKYDAEYKVESVNSSPPSKENFKPSATLPPAPEDEPSVL